MSARVTFKGGKSKVPSGPFPEAKEVVGGHWVIEVKSRKVRRMFELTDFPADVQKSPPTT